MQPDPHARAPHFSPASWGAAAALALLLGGLSLFVMGCHLVFSLDPVGCPVGQVMSTTGICETRVPNYYACDCECTGLGISATVRTPQLTNVRATPAGTVVGQTQAGSQGTILAGPEVAALPGQPPETWWQADFGNGLVGWVVATRLALVTGVPLATKSLDVCLPPQYNANLAAFDHTPSPGEIDADCSTDRVGPAFAGTAGAGLPPGSTCTCAAATFPTEWASECDADCTDLSGVCTVAGSDPPEPTPDPLPRTVYTPTSLCEVTGEAEVHIGDEVKFTSVTGLVQIHGRPCPPGGTCRVGISYQLRLGDITIPVRFHKDPKFVDLSVSGASEPEAVELAPFIGPLYAGVIPSGASLNSARGRRAGKKNLVLVGRNGSDLSVAVDWVNKRCLIDGSFVGGTGGVVDDDGNTQDLQLYLTVGGQTDELSVMVNQPPVASAGPDQTIECTSPDGADVTVNAASSTDGDGNIAFYAWRRGAADGPYVVEPSQNPGVTVHQPIGESTYHLQVVDGRLAADQDTVTVKIADTAAPDVDCQAPALVTQRRPFIFKATAADSCGPTSKVALQDLECFKVRSKGAPIKLSKFSCNALPLGDSLVLWKPKDNTLIRWQARSTDLAGNVGGKTCEVRVDVPGDDDDDD